MENIDILVSKFEQALLDIDRNRATQIFEECYNNGNRFGLLETLIIKSLESIGDGWVNGSITLSQVYMSGVICEELIEKYLPRVNIEKRDTPKMAIAVLQDYHGLGKRIVNSVLRAGGFEVLDFGNGLTVDDLVQKTIDEDVKIIIISTLLHSSALKVKDYKEKIRKKGFKTKIIVGGSPFRLDRSLWQRVGADADGKNASDIIGIIETIIKEMDK